MRWGWLRSQQRLVWSNKRQSLSQGACPFLISLEISDWLQCRAQLLTGAMQGIFPAFITPSGLERAWVHSGAPFPPDPIHWLAQGRLPLWWSAAWDILRRGMPNVATYREMEACTNGSSLTRSQGSLVCPDASCVIGV